MPPPGWLRLQQRHRDPGRPWYTKGLFCSVECLLADAGGTGQ